VSYQSHFFVSQFFYGNKGHNKSVSANVRLMVKLCELFYLEKIALVVWGIPQTSEWEFF